jgi:hypothetical protein
MDVRGALRRVEVAMAKQVVNKRLPETPEEMSGTQKTAILLLALDREAGAVLLSRMREDVIEEVTRELASVGRVPDEYRRHALEEFYTIAMANECAREGGLEYARTLLREAMDPGAADRILSQIQTQVQKTPFSFLQKADSENLLTFIQEEHPQTIALIVCAICHTRRIGDPDGAAPAEADRGDQAHREHGADQPGGHPRGGEGTGDPACEHADAVDGEARAAYRPWRRS